MGTRHPSLNKPSFTLRDFLAHTIYTQTQKREREVTPKMVELLEIYLLNLAVTVGMFAVLIFRAWLELKHFQILWKEAESRKTYEMVGRILKAEKELFKDVEGGDELYKLLTQMFNVEKQA